MNPTTPPPRLSKLDIALLSGIGIVLVYYYVVHRSFALGYSTISWLPSTWTPETGYEFGWIIVPAVAFLIWHNWKKIKAEPVEGSNAGLIWVLLAVALFILAIRTKQPRISMGGLPILLFGMTHYLFGFRVARHTVFPLAMIYFSVPVPGLIQATNGLQLLVTKAAYRLALLVGIPVYLSGNQIMLGGGGEFYVDELCSGVRSLMALLLISFVYGYYTHKERWKRLVIFAAAVPVAVIANTGRIFSILVVARIVNERIAKGVYHDYSGYLSFAIALGVLLFISRILNKGFKFTTRKVVVRKAGANAAVGNPQSENP